VRYARAAVGIAALLLASPVGAQAATLSVDAGCYTSGGTITVAGAGFTPNATVRLTGIAHVTVRADATGSFSKVALRAPQVRTATPQLRTLRATSTIDPSVRASVDFPVARALFWSNAPLNGAPHEVVTWRFAGFTRGKPIYGHLRRGGRAVTTRRFGVARGVCGVLTVRARRVPVSHPAMGRWTLKLDQRRAYSPTAPGRIIRFVIGGG
jgi:hypothetical protein